MEQQPKKYDAHDLEKLASDIYDDTDWLFTRRNIPSLYEKGGFHDRHCVLHLSDQELEYIGPILFNYAIDPPKFMEITLKGRNPYIYTNAPRGGIEFKMQYDIEQDALVTTDYSFVIENSDNNAVSVLKTMTRQPATYGKHAQTPELDHVYYSAVPATRDEQRALRAVIRTL